MAQCAEITRNGNIRVSDTVCDFVVFDSNEAQSILEFVGESGALVEVFTGTPDQLALLTQVAGVAISLVFVPAAVCWGASQILSAVKRL